MESTEAVDTSIAAIKAITDEDLDQLLDFNPEKDDLCTSAFQQHQPNVDQLAFYNNTALDTTNERTMPRYPEFDLSFSLGPTEPSLCLSEDKLDSIDLSSIATQDGHEKSMFALPQLKDEPLDLTLQSSIFVPSPTKAENNAPPGCTSNNDFNLEFSPLVSLASELTFKEKLDETAQSCSRASPMEYLALNYSQASLNEAGGTANTRRDLQPSQDNQQVDTTLIPSSVHRLYETIKKAYSDFSFVYSLGAQMCQDRIPMDCFVHLKIGLLLSIASLEDNPDRPPISVVAIGPEFGAASYLMEHIGNVAERLVGPNDDFKVPASKKGDPVWIEADPIVMARGGVYYVGDWSRLRETRVFKLLKVIECGRVDLEKTSVSCPLETAIWTHWRSFKFDKRDQHVFNKFIEIFGIPLIVEDENHEVLVDFILEQASEQEFESTIDELSICPDDMREFLSVVSKRRVDLTSEASEILRKYFVASRLDRPDCLTQRSFTTLKLFAESFAKLSLRHEVIAIDAVAAVYMTENFIQNIFGSGINSPPKFQAYNYIGAVDEHIVKFQEWLNAYVAQFHESD